MSYQQQRQHGGRLQQQQQPQPLATAVIQKPPSLKIEMGAMAQHQKQLAADTDAYIDQKEREIVELRAALGDADSLRVALHARLRKMEADMIDSKKMSNAELQQRQQEIAKLVNEKSEQQAELKDRIDKADQKYAEAQKNIKEAIVEFSKFRASSKEAITKEKERSTEAIKQEAQLSAMLGHERQDNVALHARLSEMEAELEKKQLEIAMLCNEKTELLAARDNTIACFREHVDGTEQKLARAEKLEDEIAGLITEKSELQAIYMEEKKRADEEKKRADEAERRLAKAKKLQELMSGLFSGNEHSGSGGDDGNGVVAVADDEHSATATAPESAATLATVGCQQQQTSSSRLTPTTSAAPESPSPLFGSGGGTPHENADAGREQRKRKAAAAPADDASTTGRKGGRSSTEPVGDRSRLPGR